MGRLSTGRCAAGGACDEGNDDGEDATDDGGDAGNADASDDACDDSGDGAVERGGVARLVFEARAGTGRAAMSDGDRSRFTRARNA